MERILHSNTFSRSERLRKFLQYVVEGLARNPNAAAPSEYSLGREVFGKPESFDPRKDPIVRVEAHRLRSKLNEYFAMEGRHDPVEIALLRGSYVPLIRDRSCQDWTARAGNGARRLLVMPFAALDRDKATARYLQGLLTELLDALAQLEGLHVLRLRTPSQADKVRSASRSEADVLLEINTRKQSGDVRISAQLTRPADGALFWSHIYSRSGCVSDEGETARAIAQSISSVLGLAPKYYRNAPPDTGKARRLYLRGCHFRDWQGREGLRKAVKCFERSAAEDPHCALPYAGMAETYTLMGVLGEFPARDVMRMAHAAALTALEVDPALADAHAAIGMAAACGEWDFAHAEVEFQKALGADPDCVAALQWHACCCLLPAGRLEEARGEMRRAQELAPLALLPNNMLAWVLQFSGRSQEALEHLEEALELGPDLFLTHWSLGLVYEAMALDTQAIAAFEKARDLAADVPLVLGALGHAYGVFGMSRKARAVLSELLQMALRRYISPLDIAAVYLGLGETDKVFEWLEKALEERCVRLLWLPMDPRARSLHSDPRFNELVGRSGLANAHLLTNGLSSGLRMHAG